MKLKSTNFAFFNPLIPGTIKKNILFVLVMASAIATAQELPRIAPTAPDAAALWKFEDTAVNLSSGTADISVPLFNISVHKINIPVNIVYNASGIRVNEVATQVGLGWHINAGGMISKTIYGKNDETALYDVPDNFNAEDFFDEESPNVEGVGQPDVYQYNLPHKSGRFIYNYNKTIKAATIPFDPIIIAHEKHSNYYTITDTDGTLYEFEMPTGTIFDGCTSEQIDHFNTWRLTKITTSEDNSITFNYQPNSYTYDVGINETKYETHPFAGQHAEDQLPDDLWCIQTAQVTDYLLSEIIYEGGKVQFTYSDELPIDGQPDRKDLPGALALRAVTLKDNNDLPVKSFHFEYDYFGGASTDPNELRLKLESVTEVNQEATQKKFSFVYEENKSLPGRLSYAKDHWGYFNNQVNSSSIPDINEFGFVHNGANRAPNPTSTGAHILKEIVYPTGGRTIFEYEQNQYLKPSGTQQVTRTVQVDDEHEQEEPVINPVSDLDGYFNLTEAKSLISNGSYYTVIMHVNNECYQYDEYGNQMEGDGELLFKIYDLNDNFIEDITATKSYYLNLPQGEYYVKAERPFLSECFGAVTIVWYEDELVPPTNQYIGGLRIAAITTDDNNGNIRTKEYQYNIPGTELSSGETYFKPKYLSTSYIASQLDNGGFMEMSMDQYVVLNSGSVVASEGVHYKNVTEVESGVGKIESEFYPQERAFWHVTQMKMYIENIEDYNYDIEGAYISDPYHRKGFVKCKKYFDQSDNLISKKEYLYAFDGYPVDIGNGTQSHIIANGLLSSYQFAEVGLTNIQLTHTLEYGTYKIKSSWDKLIQEKETQYFGNDYITTIKDYEYAPDSFQIRQVTTTDSHGGQQKVKYYYPHNRNELTDVANEDLNNYQKIFDQYRISEPIQVDILVNDLLTNRSRTLYNEFDPGSGLILPWRVLTIKEENMGNTLEDRLIYHNYDKHHPIEVSKAADTPVSYIWGYQQTKPVAMLEGVSYADIDPATITDLQSLSDNDTSTLSEQTLRDALNDLRDTYPGAAITTFTYDPLIGVTSITDPKGDTRFYIYDDLNRLERITDSDGNTVEVFDYNYARENEPQQ